MEAKPLSEVGLSPNIKEALKKKGRTYALMRAMAARQVAQGKRKEAPLFFPAMVTAEGVITEETERLVEVVTSNYRAAQMRRYPCHKGRDEWGITLNARVSRFRHDFRAELVFAATAYTAQMMVYAGTQWSSASTQVAHANQVSRD